MTEPLRMAKMDLLPTGAHESGDDLLQAITNRWRRLASMPGHGTFQRRTAAYTALEAEIRGLSDRYAAIIAMAGGGV
jgi:hypothetical protein